MTLALFWEKTSSFVKKYWKYLLGGLGIVLVWLKIHKDKEANSDVVTDAVEAGKKLEAIDNNASQKIENATQIAEEHHEQRMEQIKQTEEAEVKKANEELETRINDNRNDSVSELADKFGNSFGVNVVRPKND